MTHLTDFCEAQGSDVGGIHRKDQLVQLNLAVLSSRFLTFSIGEYRSNQGKHILLAFSLDYCSYRYMYSSMDLIDRDQ